MSVALRPGRRARQDHAREPAGQLLRPRFHAGVRGRGGSRPLGPTPASWSCASASEKFFSAGADVKRFLEGDVDSNMEMIRTSARRRFARIAAAPQVFIAHIAGHALGGGLEIALGLRPAARHRRQLQARYARSDAWAAARQRRHPATDSAVGALARHGPPADRQVRSRWKRRTTGAWSPRSIDDEADDGCRPTPSASPRGPALALRNDQALRQRGWPTAARPMGSRSRAELVEQLFRSHDANEGLHGLRRKAHPGLRRSMTTETITTYAGAFIDGREHANGGDPLPVTNPGTGEVFAEVPGATSDDVDAAVRRAAARSTTGRRSRYASAARSSARRRTTSRRTSTSWSRCSRASRARRCATLASRSPRRSTR